MITMRRTRSEPRWYLHKIVINEFTKELLFVSCVERFRIFGDPRKPSFGVWALAMDERTTTVYE
jgi:hypothetical protein